MTKDTNYYKQYLQLSETYLNWSGLLPKYILKSIYSKVSLSVNLFEAILLGTMIVLQIRKESDGSNLVDKMDSMCVMEMYIFVVFNIIENRCKIEQLLKKTAKCWPTNINGEDHQKEIEIRETSYIKTWIYVDFSIRVQAVFFAIMPLIFSKEPRLPLHGVTPKSKDALFYFLYVCQVHSYATFYFGIMGFYYLILGLVSILAVQYELLGKYFEQISYGNTSAIKKKIKIFVNHHNFILNDEVAKITHLFLLNQCVMMSLATITYMLPILKQNTSWTEPRLVVLCRPMVTIYFQFIICSMGQILYDKSLSVADAVYNSNWHVAEDRDLKFATLFILDLVPARPKHLTAFGSLSANYETFVAICRFTYTLFTLILTWENANV